jgi:hypothetical protein
MSGVGHSGTSGKIVFRRETRASCWARSAASVTATYFRMNVSLPDQQSSKISPAQQMHCEVRISAVRFLHNGHSAFGHQRQFVGELRGVSATHRGEMDARARLGE